MVLQLQSVAGRNFTTEKVWCGHIICQVSLSLKQFKLQFLCFFVLNGAIRDFECVYFFK